MFLEMIPNIRKPANPILIHLCLDSITQDETVTILLLGNRPHLIWNGKGSRRFSPKTATTQLQRGHTVD